MITQSPLAVLFGAQALFFCADILTKHALQLSGFSLQLLSQPAFLMGLVLRGGALFLQFWLMAQQPLGKVMTLMFVAGIIGSNLAGWLLFQEALTPKEYGGVLLAIAALVLLMA